MNKFYKMIENKFAIRKVSEMREHG